MMTCRSDRSLRGPNLPNLHFEVGKVSPLIFKRFPNLPNLPTLFFARAHTRVREIQKTLGRLGRLGRGRQEKGSRFPTSKPRLGRLGTIHGGNRKGVA
jgi:hypothetical protein